MSDSQRRCGSGTAEPEPIIASPFHPLTELNLNLLLALPQSPNGSAVPHWIAAYRLKDWWSAPSSDCHRMTRIAFGRYQLVLLNIVSAQPGERYRSATE